MFYVCIFLNNYIQQRLILQTFNQIPTIKLSSSFLQSKVGIMKSKKNLNKNQSTTDTLFRLNIQISKQQLDKKFDQLYQQSQKWKIKKQQMKEQRELAKSLQQQKICTFKPSVNPQLFFQSKQSFLKRQMAWVNKKQHKVQALIEESQKKIKKQCSFQPKLQKEEKIIDKKRIQNNYNNIHKSALTNSNKNSYKAIHSNRIANKSYKSSTNESSLLDSSRKTKKSKINNSQLKTQTVQQEQSQFVKDHKQIKIEDINEEIFYDNKQRLSTDCDQIKQQNKQEQIQNQPIVKKDVKIIFDKNEPFEEIQKNRNSNNEADDFRQENQENEQEIQIELHNAQNENNEKQEVESDSECI